MFYQSILYSLVIFFILLFGATAIYAHFEVKNRELLKTATQLHRGTKTERALVLKLLKAGIPPGAIYHDLYIKKHNGTYCQIDLVVATKVGLIVFEVKRYNGWIFGTGYQRQWTQVLAYGKEKYRFYNPIMQNDKHIFDLRKKLPQENIPYFSVIVFYGDCVLKDVSFVPDNVYLVKSDRILDVVERILNNNQPAEYQNKREIIRVLAQAAKNGEDLTVQAQHIENIRNRFGRESRV
ncbi:hypothetical protein CHU92_09435 [Flavobacterium cyanobacteriorum]|uniref:NERD domain-containing protein n=1 Tax=Flavobacterium cyanobacteriorum TaxID=2022802 RepID=A0A255Z7Y4_9FLAO|nr:nuclease-related domain-containing protein [Flavobacterium cyanobacteriorum]OYQ36740.1 hypothetical protein CHU92_09435 [Flavobacterium cyanobacteriorum]